MASIATFVCECGTRLDIREVTENPPSRDTTVIPCPGAQCTAMHIISGRVIEVFILDDAGNSTPYQWQGHDTATA
jgi:hypothetical protein